MQLLARIFEVFCTLIVVLVIITELYWGQYRVRLFHLCFVWSWISYGRFSQVFCFWLIGPLETRRNSQGCPSWGLAYSWLCSCLVVRVLWDRFLISTQFPLAYTVIVLVDSLLFGVYMISAHISKINYPSILLSACLPTYPFQSGYPDIYVISLLTLTIVNATSVPKTQYVYDTW